MNRISQAYKKYREPLLYVIVGALTTAVNFIVYFLCTRQLGINELISNGIGWVCSVAFAYFTDKTIVFQSNSFKLSTLIKEMTAFVSARLVTGVMDMGLFYILHTLMNFNDFFVKIFINVLVIIGNYLFSKFVIFKKKK